jgi:hypothetical protein
VGEPSHPITRSVVVKANFVVRWNRSVRDRQSQKLVTTSSTKDMRGRSALTALSMRGEREHRKVPRRWAPQSITAISLDATPGSRTNLSRYLMLDTLLKPSRGLPRHFSPCRQQTCRGLSLGNNAWGNLPLLWIDDRYIKVMWCSSSRKSSSLCRLPTLASRPSTFPEAHLQ